MMDRNSIIQNYIPLNKTTNTHEDRMIHALDSIASYLCSANLHLDDIASASKQIALIEGKRLSSGGNR